MKTNSIPLSRNNRRTVQARLAWRRVQPASPRASRHLRWTAGIVAKLFHRIAWSGAQAEGMALSHPDRQTLLRLQTMVRLSETRVITTQRQLVQPRIVIQQLQHVQRLQPLFFATSELRHGGDSKLSAIAPAAPLRMLRITECSILERLMLKTTASGTLSAFGELPLRIVERRTSGRPHFVTEDEAPSLPERVIRKLRRLEERPFHHARQAAVRMLAAPTPEESPAVHRHWRDFSPQAEPSFEARTAGRAVKQPAAVNVAQITDAVLQQLDRRLVSARERMGRI
jgi:hypothetical protein